MLPSTFYTLDCPFVVENETEQSTYIWKETLIVEKISELLFSDRLVVKRFSLHTRHNVINIGNELTVCDLIQEGYRTEIRCVIEYSYS